MSKIALQPNASGTGTFTLASPNSNTNRTLTLPDTDGALLTDGSSLDASNLTGALPAIDGSALTGIDVTPSTADVLSATAGATEGAVGTYAWLINTVVDAGSAWGATVAGSSLRSAGLATNNSTSVVSGNVTASGYGQGTIQSGTWRAMGQSNFSNMYDGRTTLFLRIS
jgi:hypothetical protein